MVPGQGGALNYRPDIDGLRAVAVVPVVLYHAGFTALGGGYVGVDVFFVISGYLITSLLLGDIRRGEFSILKFYERRIRRIFPALFAVIAVSAVAACFLFMPDELAYFARSAAATALFASNIQFWDESGYFDAEAQIKPLLHTWSLAVEEQFYILFPLLLAALARLHTQKLAWVLGVLWLLSFIASLWAQQYAPVFNFFWSPPRFWELLTGSLLATGALPLLSAAGSRRLVVAGLALIAFAVFYYDESTPFPGFAALLPCLGSAFVIHGGAGPGPANRLLTFRPVVWIGLISYSLYLWHWPIIVFVRNWLGGDVSLLVASAIVTLATLVAYLSWRWIEQPFRGKRVLKSRKSVLAFAGGAMLTAVCLGLSINALNGLPSRLPVQAREIYAAKQDLGPFHSPHCFISQDDPAWPHDIGMAEVCRLGKIGQVGVDFVVWGDSHAPAIAPGIDLVARKHNRSGVLLARATCPPLLQFERGRGKQQQIDRCVDNNAAVMRFIASQHVPVVFLVGRWPKYVHRAEFGNEGVFYDPGDRVVLDNFSRQLTASLDITLNELTRAGASSVLVMDVPEMGYDVPEALAKASMRGDSMEIAPPREIVRQRQALALSTLKLAAKNHHAVLIDPTPLICDNLMCRVRDGNTVLYADEDHLSESGSLLMAPAFEAFFASWHRAD